MENNLNRVATDLIDQKLSDFPKLVLKDKDNQVIPPTMDDQIENARIFDFEFVSNGINFGPVTVTISDNDGLQIKTYSDPVEGKDDREQDLWYDFIKGISEFATNHVIQFKGPKIVTQKIKPKNEVGESKMTESRLVGTSKTSYQDLGEATLIVKHSQPINYNAANGRTQHIESIFIENAQGERFRYPYKHLNGARALATHIVAGGTPYDDIGQYVISLSEELNKLRMFKGYVTRSPMVAEAMGGITDKVVNRIDGIKKEIHHLQNKNYYAEWAEGFSKREARDIPEDMAAEWVDRLTIKSFNEDLKSVFPYLFNIIEESDLPTKELDAEDLLNGYQQVQEFTNQEREIQELVDLENFVDNIVKEDTESGIFSNEQSDRDQAVEKLNMLIVDSADATVGLNGENGKNLIADLISSEDLMNEIEDRARDSEEGSATPLWPIVKEFLEFRAPELLTDNGGAINFETQAEAPVEPVEPAVPAEPAPTEEPAPAQESWQGALESKLSKIKSLAEQAGKDFNSVTLMLNGKSYSLAEALTAFNMLDEGKDKDDEDEDNGEEWYDKDGRPSKHGAYDAGGHYHKERDVDEDNKKDNDPPFDPDPPKKNPSAVAGKHGQGYSTARHLARQGRAQAEKKSLTKEIQEMVKSFTNLVPERMDQGPFPLGEEGVITKVTKDMAEKYGREEDKRFKHAVETYCRECVGKLSAVYETYRMKKLAGLDADMEEGSIQNGVWVASPDKGVPPPSPNEGPTASVKGKPTKAPIVTQGPNKGKTWSPQTPGPTNPSYKPIDRGIPSPDEGAPPKGFTKEEGLSAIRKLAGLQ